MRRLSLWIAIVGGASLAVLASPLSARGLGITATASGLGITASASVSPLGEYEDLVSEYKSTVKAHREKIRASDSKEERRALRKSHPAQDFSARFQALAEAGEPEAYLWLIQRAKDRGIARADLFAEKSRLYESFFSAGATGEPLEEGVQLLLGDSSFRRGEGPAEVDRLFALALEKAPTEADQVALRVISAMRLARSKDEESRSRGLALLKSLAEKHPEHPSMEGVKKKLFALEHLTVGTIAPDFSGKTIDGTAIKLSDYRGKVVVLDFFGFW
ncbi:MAG: redoxin domain-containing protein [Planctomycetota bacterium]